MQPLMLDASYRQQACVDMILAPKHSAHVCGSWVGLMFYVHLRRSIEHAVTDDLFKSGLLLDHSCQWVGGVNFYSLEHA